MATSINEGLGGGFTLSPNELNIDQIEQAIDDVSTDELEFDIDIAGKCPSSDKNFIIIVLEGTPFDANAVNYKLQDGLAIADADRIDRFRSTMNYTAAVPGGGVASIVCPKVESVCYGAIAYGKWDDFKKWRAFQKENPGKVVLTTMEKSQFLGQHRFVDDGRGTLVKAETIAGEDHLCECLLCSNPARPTSGSSVCEGNMNNPRRNVKCKSEILLGWKNKMEKCKAPVDHSAALQECRSKLLTWVLDSNATTAAVANAELHGGWNGKPLRKICFIRENNLHRWDSSRPRPWLRTSYCQADGMGIRRMVLRVGRFPENVVAERPVKRQRRMVVVKAEDVPGATSIEKACNDDEEYDAIIWVRSGREEVFSGAPDALAAALTKKPGRVQGLHGVVVVDDYDVNRVYFGVEDENSDAGGKTCCAICDNVLHQGSAGCTNATCPKGLAQYDPRSKRYE